MTWDYMERDMTNIEYTLLWRHNGRDSISNHQPHDCLLNRLFRRRSKKISKLRVTGLCAGNSPGTGEFPAQMSSNAATVSIWWRHHDITICNLTPYSTGELWRVFYNSFGERSSYYNEVNWAIFYNADAIIVPNIVACYSNFRKSYITWPSRWFMCNV